MFDDAWNLFEQTLSGERAKEFTTRINAHARYCTSDEMQRTAQEAADLMRRVGLEDVELMEMPADGRTSHCGWVNPIACDVESATLQVVSPKAGQVKLADFKKDPYSLMVRSAPTPPRGRRAELVIVDDAGNPEAWRGKDVRGKIVLIDARGYLPAMSAFARGALGLVGDNTPMDPYVKRERDLRNARHWHGFTLPTWKTAKTGFGFSITPNQGARLRRMIAAGKKVVLKAVVKSRLYDGKLNVVTGLLPGRSDAEVALTAHLYEPGADDNASGVGLALEVARSMRALVKQAKIARPKRGLRLIFGMEVRGTNAYLARRPHAKRLRGGLNIDMVGAGQDFSRSTCQVLPSLPCNPSYAEALMLALTERAGRKSRSLRYALKGSWETDDNAMGDLAFNAPCPIVYMLPALHWHVNIDRPEILDPATFHLLGTAFATYCHFVADAGYDQARWLAELADDFTRARVVEECSGLALETAPSGDAAVTAGLSERFAYLAEQAKARVRSVHRLIEVPEIVPLPDGRWSYVEDPELYDAKAGLRKDVLLARHVERLVSKTDRFIKSQERDLVARLRRRDPALLAKLDRPARASASAKRTASRLAPVKTAPGFLAWDVIPERRRAALLGAIGEKMEWCAPAWAQSAILRCTGKRNLLDIWKDVCAEGEGVQLERMIALARGLAREGLVELLPVITKARIARTLARLGVRRGDVMLAHTSMSYFGYVEGGPDTVIDAFLEVLGPRGTLVMPTMTFSRQGVEPFDRKRSPSKVGLISETFRQRPGVLRSGHVSHSLAALGPKARAIVRGHTHMKPLFAKGTPWARLYDMNVWLLMFAPRNSSTILHMGEYRGGVPYFNRIASMKTAGRTTDVVVRAMPFHSRFDGVYERLEARRQLRKARLGRRSLYLMKARDAVDAATEYFREDITRATGEGCDCAVCRHIRSHV